ncbi:MAG: pilus assembly protein [Vannielia sp.]|uniref:TadE/TadG family type IV pilus assembly protein n=1 Tax=Vannielia sp. TaxID=2813045 RepID=UPI003B8CB8F8
MQRLRETACIEWVSERFVKDEEGAATIEAVLWMPVMIALLCFAVDVSLIFFGQNQAYRVVQDANRSLSTGRLGTAGEVEQYVQANLSAMTPNATIRASVVDGMVSTVVRMPSSDLAITGMLSALMNTTITVGGRHLVEY